ncbi:MAG TPA: exodeoxyribonuclease VII large subunit [Prolixibacteraceae bacterium]|nr:exodeoxyribonuclease VII large subunit [Prolixibacteraceae bacterium]HUM88193.1 exodeoxyribonuclease VII large subunit [Prolixibacteraceae bacterium]
MEGQLTLTQLNERIKSTLQDAFSEQLWIIAEIAEMKVNRTGHCYLELIDKENKTEEITARARATIWSWQFRFIQPYFETTTGQTLSAGLKVLISVSIEFHEVYGYSLNIKDIDPTYTLGDIARRRAEIINRLSDEGIIDMNKEIPLADIPSRIAIISSPTAAGYEDFINQLYNNQAGYHFYTKLFAATMQGNEAAKSVITALDTIYDYEHLFDVVVIIRGGGSQVDLACFDDYNLAQHIAQFPLPVLTGIGHEKDDTIADLVAHTRLKTPTAVAEFLIGKLNVVDNELETLKFALEEISSNKLSEEENRVNHALRMLKPFVVNKIEKSKRILDQKNMRVKSAVRGEINQQQLALTHFFTALSSDSQLYLKMKNKELQTLSSKATLKTKFGISSEKQHLAAIERSISTGIKQLVDKQKYRLQSLEKNKELVDPITILKRGFSITLKEGKAIKNDSHVSEGEYIETILAEGKIASIIQKKE